jgi:hypothetical protein
MNDKEQHESFSDLKQDFLKNTEYIIKAAEY